MLCRLSMADGTPTGGVCMDLCLAIELIQETGL